MRINNSLVQKKLSYQYDSVDAPLPLWVSVLAALLSGAVFLFALAPYKIWVIALLSPLVLYGLLLPKISPKHAFLIGWAYGFGVWVTGAFWLYTSIHDYGAVPAWLALLMIAMMAAVMGLFHAVMAWGFVRFLGKQPLAFAAIWVGQEWLKTWLFTGFPWLFVGYAFTEVPFVSSLAPVLGVFAISFLAVFISASLIDALRGKAGFLLMGALGVAISTLLWQIKPTWTTPTNEKLSISLVQGNIPQDLKWLTEYRFKTLEIYTRLSSTEWGRDSVIWPEAAIPLLYDEAAPFVSEMSRVASQTHSAWVTGIPYQDFEHFNPAIDRYPPLYNAVMALGENSGGLYKKQRLVPFGEYIPLQGLFNILPDLAHSSDMYSHTAGGVGQAALNVHGKKMGSAICYEVAYPDTTRQNAKDSEFLLTISNDAWFGTSAGPYQHLQMVQMRSLETGRWFARATNTGVTAVIDDRGQIVTKAPQFEEAVLRADIAMMTGQTPYVRFGNYPMLALITLLMALSLWGKRQNTLHDGEYGYGVRH